MADKGKVLSFFCKFLEADCERIAIENPVGIISGNYVKQFFPDIAEKYGLPKKPTQSIQPWMFGDNFEKTTCFWLKGLHPLIPQTMEKPEFEYHEWVDKRTGKKKRRVKWFFETASLPQAERSRARSKTFPGIAKAMAEQWGRELDGGETVLILDEEQQVKFW